MTRRRLNGGIVMISQVVQVLGSLLILVPFALAQLGRAGARSRSYQLFNLVGSSALAADAAVTGQWGFLLLEGSWAVMSVAGLVRSNGSPVREQRSRTGS
jgi:hypothetical protein